MRQRYQRGRLRCARRKAGPDRWEFLWRETDETGKRVRRTAIIGTVERYPTRDLAQAAANGLRMQVNEDRLRHPAPTLLLPLCRSNALTVDVGIGTNLSGLRQIGNYCEKVAQWSVGP